MALFSTWRRDEREVRILAEKHLDGGEREKLNERIEQRKRKELEGWLTKRAMTKSHIFRSGRILNVFTKVTWWKEKLRPTTTCHTC